MDKISALVRKMMLRYPSLYANRFEALAEVLTNSCYEWRGGELTEVFPMEPATPATMVKEFEQELAEFREKAAREKCDCLHAFNRRLVIEAERKLLEAKHIADNIEVYATDYTVCGYEQAHAWLHRADRYGVSEYWSINNKPSDITDAWRDAIYEWLMFLMPSANGLMGICQPDGFDAIPRYAETFNWLKAKCSEYEPPRDPEHESRMRELAREIADKVRQTS